MLYHFLERQRFLAAFLAISDRRAAESFAARARPPLSPPSLPSATAAGFFSGSVGEVGRLPVTAFTTENAVVFRSGLELERLGMPYAATGTEAALVDFHFPGFKLTHYRSMRHLDSNALQN